MVADVATGNWSPLESSSTLLFLLSPSVHHQEGPPHYEPGPAPGFFLWKGSFFLPLLLVGVRIWVSESLRTPELKWIQTRGHCGPTLKDGTGGGLINQVLFTAPTSKWPGESGLSALVQTLPYRQHFTVLAPFIVSWPWKSKCNQKITLFQWVG